MRAQIKCLKQKYKMEAQLHTGNNDLKHSVRNIYRGRGPRVVGTLPWAGGDGHSPTHWDSQFKPVITTVPHHELNLEKESFNLEMRQHTPNVYTKVPGVESLQLLIQKTHSSPQFVHSGRRSEKADCRSHGYRNISLQKRNYSRCHHHWAALQDFFL